MTMERILIVGPAWVGDMVMSQTLYKLLKAREPETGIDVLAPRSSLSMVSRMAEVSLGIPLDTGHGELKFGYRRGLGRRLRERGYGRAIVLPNSLKSALVPFFAGIDTRTGFRGEYRYYLINDMRLLDKDGLPRMIDRFVALGLPQGAPIPDDIVYPSLMVDHDNRDRLCDELELTTDRPILGLCPGAEYGEAKKWPEQHYGSLAGFALERGMGVWLFGSDKDRETAGRIVAAMPAASRHGVLDLTGETSLTDVVDLLSLCRLVVSNDSGLMHVAAAVGCSTVVIYGSTSPEFTPPLTERVHIVSDNLPCSPCFQRTCPLGHKNCLNQLMPERVEHIVASYADGP